MSESHLHIGGLCAAPGEKVSGMYSVTTTAHQMPVTIINGKQNGKTVLITAGIHGGEYVGIQAAIELAGELSADLICGKVILVHPVNTSAFGQLAAAIIPESGENLNRLFPGNPEGTHGQRIAHALTTDFQDKADFYIDMHGGDLHEALTPFVFYPGAADEKVTAEARRVALGLGVSYMVRSRATTGAYNSAAVRGIPSLLIERGASGLWSNAEVTAYKQDIYAALRALGVCPGLHGNAPQKTPLEVVNPVYVAADSEGCWYPRVAPGGTFRQGDLLGRLCDCFGAVLAEYTAAGDGVMLYQACSLAVKKGTEILAYGQVQAEPACSCGCR